MNLEVLMNKAIMAIREIDSPKRFIVKDLFEGYEWNSLAKGDRISFGKCFKNCVESGRIPDVQYLGKQSNNSALYYKMIAEDERL